MIKSIITKATQIKHKYKLTLTMNVSAFNMMFGEQSLKFCIKKSTCEIGRIDFLLTVIEML